MPSYYVKTTMGKNCNLTNPEYVNPSNIHCGKKYANKDLFEKYFSLDVLFQIHITTCCLLKFEILKTG